MCYICTKTNMCIYIYMRWAMQSAMGSGTAVCPIASVHPAVELMCVYTYLFFNPEFNKCTCIFFTTFPHTCLCSASTGTSHWILHETLLSATIHSAPKEPNKRQTESDFQLTPLQAGQRWQNERRNYVCSFPIADVCAIKTHHRYVNWSSKDTWELYFNSQETTTCCSSNYVY